MGVNNRPPDPPTLHIPGPPDPQVHRESPECPTPRAFDEHDRYDITEHDITEQNMIEQSVSEQSMTEQCMPEQSKPEQSMAEQNKT